MKLYNNAIQTDVICEHTTDGTIIPLRCRFQDEEGIFTEYTLIGYNQLIPDNDGYVSDRLYVGPHAIAYDCKIKAYDRIRLIRLLYDMKKNRWEIRY